MLVVWILKEFSEQLCPHRNEGYRLVSFFFTHHPRHVNLYEPARPRKPRNTPRQSTCLCFSGSVLPIIIRTLIIIQRLSCNCQFADLCPAGRAGPRRSANSQNRSVYRRPAASLYGNRPGHSVQRAANRQLKDRRWINDRGGLMPGKNCVWGRYLFRRQRKMYL